MRGLFLKDLLLISKRKQSLLIFVAVMIAMGFTMGSEFLIGYGTMLFGIFSLGSLSYDDFDNCMPFLLSLPVTRRQYVLEKYLFVASGITLGWLLSIVISCIICIAKQESVPIKDSASEIIILLPICISLISILLPIELKYGVERSRTVLIVIGGAALILGFAFSKLLPETASIYFQSINNIPTTIIVIITFLVSFILLIVSYFISCNIVNKKEY